MKKELKGMFKDIDQAMTRPDYSGPDVTCDMCGQDGAEMEYVHMGQRELAVPGSTPDPHLARTCKTCGYEWEEKTVLESPPELEYAGDGDPRLVPKHIKIFNRVLYVLLQRPDNRAVWMELDNLLGNMRERSMTQHAFIPVALGYVREKDRDNFPDCFWEHSGTATIAGAYTEAIEEFAKRGGHIITHFPTVHDVLKFFVQFEEVRFLEFYCSIYRLAEDGDSYKWIDHKTAPVSVAFKAVGVAHTKGQTHWEFLLRSYGDVDSALEDFCNSGGLLVSEIPETLTIEERPLSKTDLLKRRQEEEARALKEYEEELVKLEGGSEEEDPGARTSDPSQHPDGCGCDACPGSKQF
jgi:hypothetical protein